MVVSKEPAKVSAVLVPLAGSVAVRVIEGFTTMLCDPPSQARVVGEGLPPDKVRVADAPELSIVQVAGTVTVKDTAEYWH